MNRNGRRLGATMHQPSKDAIRRNLYMTQEALTEKEEWCAELEQSHRALWHMVYSLRAKLGWARKKQEVRSVD